MQTQLSLQEKILLCSLILMGIFLRWYQLDLRPFHHDESLHAIYGLYFFTDPDYQFYRYDPMLHGPLLYNVLTYIYTFFGTSKFAARALGAILGSSWLVLPYLFRKYLPKQVLFLGTLYLALSPSLIYWSRFLKHDFIVTSLLLAILVVICLVKSERLKMLIIPAFISLIFCTKANAYLYLMFILAYFIFEFLAVRFIDKNDHKKATLYQTAWTRIKQYPVFLFLGTAVAVFLFCYYYSSGFRYPQGILDGLYRKSLSYWLEQHHIERISGPFSFQFFILSWYEGLFVVGMLLQFIHFYFNSTQVLRWLVSVPIFISTAFYLGQRFNLLAPMHENALANFFKLKLPFDYISCFCLIAYGPIIAIHHWQRGERSLAFFGYFFIASFFTYSYVGEKVPWLSLYPLVAGLAYFMLYLSLNQTTISKKWFNLSFIILFTFNLCLAIPVNFINWKNNHEVISQVQTTQSYEQVLLKIKEEIKYRKDSGQSPPTVINFKENSWPMSWYFYGQPEYAFFLSGQKLSDFDYVFSHQFDPEADMLLQATHHKSFLPLRGWWMPDYQAMTLGKFITYAIFHKPWNNSGEQMVSLYVKYQSAKKP